MGDKMRIFLYFACRVRGGPLTAGSPGRQAPSVFRRMRSILSIVTCRTRQCSRCPDSVRTQPIAVRRSFIPFKEDLHVILFRHDCPSISVYPSCILWHSPCLKTGNAMLGMVSSGSIYHSSGFYRRVFRIL